MSNFLLFWVSMPKGKYMNLDKLRNQIDDIDEEILILLSKRFQIVKAIQQSKSKAGLPISDKKRESHVLRELEKLSMRLNLQFSIVKKLYKVIFLQSRIIQHGQK